MSKKISKYFKVTPKSTENLENNKSNFKSVENSFKIRDSQVIIKDIKDHLPKNLKLFEEFSLNYLQNIESKIPKKGQNKKCKYCEKEFSKRSNLHHHIKFAHSDQISFLRCLICNLKFIKQEFLNKHVETKHPEGLIEQFECDFDGKIFKTKGALYRHMIGHFALVECKICQKILKPWSMGPHMSFLHETERNFQCKICSKSFKLKSLLNSHLKTHNKKFECEICKKMFSYSSKLNEHKRLYHEKERNFECESCDKKFNQKPHLKNHQKVHDKIRLKPYKCQQCDFATDNKHHFKGHQKFHERQNQKYAAMKNPLKCEKCPTLHRNQLFLKLHMKSVHPKVLFQCDLCAKFIKIKIRLINHMKVHISKII